MQLNKNCRVLTTDTTLYIKCSYRELVCMNFLLLVLLFFIPQALNDLELVHSDSIRRVGNCLFKTEINFVTIPLRLLSNGKYVI